MSPRQAGPCPAALMGSAALSGLAPPWIGFWGLAIAIEAIVVFWPTAVARDKSGERAIAE